MNNYSVQNHVRRVDEASNSLAQASSSQKNDALAKVADQLRKETERILAANKTDVQRARSGDRSTAFVDRLRLNETRIDSMASDIEEIIALPDPVGGEDSSWVRPNGLRVSRRRIPLGVIGMIYEARPNVTTDATALCIKSGNGAYLKGGSDAFDSNKAIYESIRRGLDESNLPPDATDAIGFVDTTDREAVGDMLEASDLIDVIIPRGGEGLIKFVTQNSQIPVIKHEKGVCHMVIDGSAPAKRVDDIVLNAKTQRPSVCNAIETILFLDNSVDKHLPRVLKRLEDAGVFLHLDSEALGHAERAELSDGSYRKADDSSYHTEFLDLEVAVRVVEDLDEAENHIQTFGSSHTEALLTDKYEQSETFKDRIDSSVLVVNASTRFSDGNQLGLGAEIGISTTRLQAYGPMGLRELTTTKFVVTGKGQTRT